jgi:hypothetical protein
MVGLIFQGIQHFGWLESSHRIDMSNMWFTHELFPSNSWRQDQLLQLSDAGCLGNISLGNRRTYLGRTILSQRDHRSV